MNKKKRKIKEKNLTIFLLSFVIIFLVILFSQSGKNFDNVVSFDGVSEDYKCSDCNVILITIDALRPDHLGCYGYEKNTSPNIDKLAKEGVLFTQAISQGSWTATSLPSLITSSYPSTSGIFYWNQVFPLNSIDILPKLLKSKGYNTAFISAHSIIFKGNPDMFDFSKKINGAKADRIVQETELWIENNQNNPFFIWLHLMDLHDVPAPGPEERPIILDSIYVDKYTSMYDEKLRYVDVQLKDLLEKLDFLGITESTLIIISADHGEGINDHGLFFDHSMYLWDSLIMVPLIIYYPQPFLQNKTIDCQVQLIDIAPTICDFLKIKKPITFEGKTLFSFEDNKSFCSTYAFSEHQQIDETDDKGNLLYTKVSVRSSDWKLIYTYNQHSKKYELYNLKNDPKELNDIVDIEKDQFELMKAELEEWMSREKQNIIPLTKPLDEKTKEKLRSLGYLQ